MAPGNQFLLLDMMGSLFALKDEKKASMVPPFGAKK